MGSGPGCRWLSEAQMRSLSRAAARSTQEWNLVRELFEGAPPRDRTATDLIRRVRRRLSPRLLPRKRDSTLAASAFMLSARGSTGSVRPGAAVIILLTLLGAGAFLYLAFVYPHRDLGPKQPIPFSHRIHAGAKAINCRFCHPFVERSARAGIPEVGKCLYCHNTVIPQHPEIVKEHEYYNTGTPVPWVRLFVAKDFVFFRHQPHILRGFDCVECHGDVKTMDRLPQHTFEMGFCITCHRANEASLQCWLACHN